jgi:MSHA biogenesis protein MshP
MYLRTQSPVASRQPPAQTRQGGWLMPMAAFIIVVMGLLAAGMARVGSQTSVAGVQEQISVQTFYAAESGAQYAMNRLFYDTATAVTRTSASAACGSINGSTLNLNAPGMLNCQVNVLCQESVDTGNTTSFFLINSAASCGTGSVTSTRTVQVSASLK